MTYYLVAKVEFHDPDWWDDYMRNVTPLVYKHGGKFLARTENYEPIAGENKANVCAIVEWPDKQNFFDFRDDPDFKPWQQNRLGGGSTNAVLISAEDDLDKLT